MSGDRIGIWLIGAWGRAGTAIAIVLAALQSRLISTDGLVTEQPEFVSLGLADWSRFVLGGHEIRKTSAAVEARNLFANSQSVTSSLLSGLGSLLSVWDRNVRTGTLLNASPAVTGLAHSAALKTKGERPAAALRRISTDLAELRDVADVEHMIVCNLASPEPRAAPGCSGLSWGELSQMLEKAERSPIPTSALYAVAAMQSGCSFLNLTSSLGSDLPALGELATHSGSLHMGREARNDLASIGLLKTSPIFEEVAGGEWLRAARTALDLTRLCEREHRREQSGALTQFSCFFVRPMGDGPPDVPDQLAVLHDWADRVSSQADRPRAGASDG